MKANFSFAYVGRIILTGVNIFYPDNYLSNETMSLILNKSLEAMVNVINGGDVSFD